MKTAKDVRKIVEDIYKRNKEIEKKKERKILSKRKKFEKEVRDLLFHKAKEFIDDKIMPKIISAAKESDITIGMVIFRDYAANEYCPDIPKKILEIIANDNEYKEKEGGGFGVQDKRFYFVAYLEEILEDKGFEFEERWLSSPTSRYSGPSKDSSYVTFLIEISW